MQKQKHTTATTTTTQTESFPIFDSSESHCSCYLNMGTKQHTPVTRAISKYAKREDAEQKSNKKKNSGNMLRTLNEMKSRLSESVSWSVRAYE